MTMSPHPPAPAAEASRAARALPPRIAPVEPPYPPLISETLARWMPRGTDVPPLALFRVLAVHPALAEAMRPLGAFLLGRQPRLTRRERELAILRTCARAGAAYEWGVHAAAFAASVGLSEAEVGATADAAGAREFTGRERALVDALDELHATATLSDDAWAALAAHFDPEARMELLAVAGFYRLIALFVNALRVPAEPWAAAMP